MIAVRAPRLLAAAVLLASGVYSVAGSQDAASSTPTCVAVVLPSVQGVQGSAEEVASGVRDLFVSFLTGPSIKSFPVDARLPSQAVLEAHQKGCEHVLIPSLIRRRSDGGKWGGIVGQAMGTAAWRVPYGSGVGGAVAAGAAAGAAQAVSSFAAETAKKDEIELSYRLGTPETVEQSRPVTAKAKAKVDGEDLLTPLVERAAQDIAAATTTR